METINYEDRKIVGIIASNVDNPNLLVADYPKDMLETRTDEELVDAISNKENDKLEYMGAIIYGKTKDVDEITGKFQLWRMD